MNDDDDIRAALARAHEPAPSFAAVRARAVAPPRLGPAQRLGLVLVPLAAAAAAVFVVSRPPPPAPLDLSSPALSSASIETPLDSLLDVPGLDVLGTTPNLVNGDLP